MTRWGYFAVVCIAALGVGCGRDDRAAGGAGQPAAATADMERFVRQAAVANMAEIELGKLATQRAQHADVKAYANMMIDDHSTALGQLREAAGSQRLTLPTQLDDDHQKVHDRLSGLQGDEFDREYMKVMVESHEDTEDLLDDHAGDRAGATGTSATDTGASASATASLNGWAASTLPKVRTHLEQARSLEERLENMPKPQTRTR